MPESTRVGTVGNLEVHLKKQIEITREMVNEIPTLPDTDPWYVATKNTNTGEWTFEQSFDSFADAQDRFVTVCQNEGIDDAGTLQVGGKGGRGRVFSG